MAEQIILLGKRYEPVSHAPLIVRDWYELHEWQLRGDACAACGTQIAGVFEAEPGDWGRKRQRVDMRAYAEVA